MLRKRLVLGELEVKVLGVLWESGPATVADVVAALPTEEARHYNTVATVLRRLLERDVVTRVKDGRGYVFSAAVTREELARRYFSLVREELYGGSWSRLVAALLTPGTKGGRTEEKLAELLGKLTRETPE